MHVVTDDERLAVARRLRECKSHIDSTGWFWLSDGLYGVHVLSGSEERLRRGTARLADLIEPPYPDATASYKGWRVQVYDPDGELVSPSNVAADLVRAHADGKVPDEPKVRCVAEVKIDGERLGKLVHDAAVKLTGIDRDALLALADRMENMAGMGALLTANGLEMAAASIREALGEVVE